MDLIGIKIGRNNTKVAVAAYADDMTVFLTSPVVSQKLQEILSTYEAATGAKVNRQKSSALALGHWDGSSLISNIPYSQVVRILGFKFTNRVNVAANMSWSIVSSRVRSATQDTYYRDMNLAMRIKFVNIFLLARIWYVAQVFPHQRITFARLAPPLHGSYGVGISSGYHYPHCNVGSPVGVGLNSCLGKMSGHVP